MPIDSPTVPVCILLRGLPCVGKTTLGRALARRLRFVLLVKDDVRGPTMQHDAAMRDCLMERGVDESVAMLVDSNDACYRAINAIAVTQLAVGSRGCILDSPLGRPAVANEATKTLTEAGASCILVNCVVERSIWVQRLQERRESPVTAGAAHATAHTALPEDPTLIESHYPQGLDFNVSGVEQVVQVDCALPVEHGVQQVVDVINSLT